MTPKNIMSKNTMMDPIAKPLTMVFSSLAAQTLCQLPWLNISALQTARMRVTAATKPSTVQLLAVLNWSNEGWLEGSTEIAITRIITRQTIKTPWNLSVTMLAGTPATA